MLLNILLIPNVLSTNMLFPAPSPYGGGQYTNLINKQWLIYNNDENNKCLHALNEWGIQMSDLPASLVVFYGGFEFSKRTAWILKKRRIGGETIRCCFHSKCLHISFIYYTKISWAYGITIVSCPDNEQDHTLPTSINTLALGLPSHSVYDTWIMAFR